MGEFGLKIVFKFVNFGCGGVLWAVVALGSGEIV